MTAQAEPFSFKNMIMMVILDIIPRRLLKIKPPVCVACKIGAMTKQLWRVKEIRNKYQLNPLESKLLIVPSGYDQQKFSNYRFSVIKV